MPTVKTDKLAKQLKKELTRNLKKTAALGLVTLVALWFWAPLVWKWVGGDPKKKARKAAAVAAQAADAAPEATATPTDAAPAAAPVPKIHWDQLLTRISGDENMATATLKPGARDPFKVTTVEEQVVATAPLVEGAPNTPVRAAAVQDPTPESMGLVLEATFVSRQTRRATINGKNYRVGQSVPVKPSEQAASAEGENTTESSKPLAYTVKTIEARRVILTRQGKEFPLVLKRETLTDDEQLSFGASPPSPTQQ